MTDRTLPFARGLDLPDEVVTQTIASSWTEYAEKLRAGGDSVLARLSREELDDGLAALRARAAEEDDHAIVEPIDLLVFR